MPLSLYSGRKFRWLKELYAAQRINTPSLVIDTDEIGSILKLFTKYLPEVQLFYAVKANNTSALLQYLKEKGINFDVASAPEIQAVRALNVESSRLILSNPIKSQETINAFLVNDVRLTVIDNIFDLEMLEKAAQERGISTSAIGIFVRIRIPSTEVKLT